jgi:hypothetical protein
LGPSSSPHGLLTAFIWVRPADGNAPFRATHSWLVGDARPLAAATALVAAADRYVQELGPNWTGRYDRSGKHQLRFWKELG